MNTFSLHLHFLRDPWFHVCLGFGLTTLLLPPVPDPPGVLPILLFALAEEIIFRMGLQQALSRPLERASILRSLPITFPVLAVSPANLATSTIFCLAHLPGHPPLWALAVFVPSLVFGVMWDRHRTILPCWIIHAAYNLLYFHRGVW